ncbi:MAG: tRNA (guanosine(37)-N1)-methyltransferase TrmD [Selenomonadaceae bacterium]|nr:tRNA (guanosine(37)-N1)-methyltransferase TrmD [Selenomonadaceae bacterium]
MRVDMLTLFPSMFAGPFGDSIIKRAIDKGLLTVHYTNFRDFATDKHHQVDDTPFGGGSGMVLKPEPLFAAVGQVLDSDKTGISPSKRRVLLMDPSGVPFTQAKAKELAKLDWLIFICGHYEGYDARIANLADEAISLGDYVLTGGELPAMVITDAVARMLPGVLGAADSATTDSFYDGILGYPQYTKPREFAGLTVPEVLISGDHAKINRWRRQEALKATYEKRPDLLAKVELSAEDRAFLQGIAAI